MKTFGKKIVEFNGKRFVRDEKSGYYRHSVKGTTILLHRYVWECANCEIPKGYEVHHVDGDKDNNDIENLRLITRSEHLKIHSDMLTEEQRAWRRKNVIDNAVPSAVSWHRSKEGREWHRKHYSEGEGLHVRCNMKCKHCGKEFDADKYHSRFCSNKCKSAFRRKSGVDDVELICKICGKKFKANKYSHAVVCSIACRAKFIAEKKRSKR